MSGWASRFSSTSKLKQPDLHEKRLSGFVPSASSSASVKPSLSSSGSALLPIPSPSVSIVSEESRGNWSALLGTPSSSVSSLGLRTLTTAPKPESPLIC